MNDYMVGYMNGSINQCVDRWMYKRKNNEWYNGNIVSLFLLDRYMTSSDKPTSEPGAFCTSSEDMHLSSLNN